MAYGKMAHMMKDYGKQTMGNCHMAKRHDIEFNRVFQYKRLWILKIRASSFLGNNL